MIDHLTHTPNLLRVLAIAQLGVMIFCGVYLQQSYRGALPRALYWAGWAYGSVLVLVALALGLNIYVPTPPTEGLKLVTAGFVPPTVVAVVSVFVILRGGVRHRRQVNSRS